MWVLRTLRRSRRGCRLWHRSIRLQKKFRTFVILRLVLSIGRVVCWRIRKILLRRRLIVMRLLIVRLRVYFKLKFLIMKSWLFILIRVLGILRFLLRLRILRSILIGTFFVVIPLMTQRTFRFLLPVRRRNGCILLLGMRFIMLLRRRNPSIRV